MGCEPCLSGTRAPDRRGDCGGGAFAFGYDGARLRLRHRPAQFSAAWPRGADDLGRQFDRDAGGAGGEDRCARGPRRDAGLSPGLDGGCATGAAL